MDACNLPDPQLSSAQQQPVLKIKLEKTCVPHTSVHFPRAIFKTLGTECSVKYSSGMNDGCMGYICVEC